MTKKKKWDFRPEELEAYRRGGFELIPLNRPDAVDRRGRAVGKAPLNAGWRRSPPVSVADALQLMQEEGHNVGVRLRPTDLVIDVDPRNFADGDDPFAQLQADLGVDLGSAPTVWTGSGGRHVYLSKPDGFEIRDTLDAYPGIEFKSSGRQVVAAGSVHPTTGKPYEFDTLCDDLSRVRAAPQSLLEVIKRPGRLAGVAAGKLQEHGGPEALEQALEFLDVTEYGRGQHDKWFQLMCACHHATAGEGRAEFIAWCMGDPDYSSGSSDVGRRWDSLHSDGTGNITWRHLFRSVGATGEAGKAWVRQIDRVKAEDDFPSYDDEDERRDLDEILRSLPEGSRDVSEALEWFNSQGFCAVYDEGQFRVMRQVEDHVGNYGRKVWESAKKQDFLNYYETKRVESVDAKGKTTVTPLAPAWLRWPGRREYEKVVFDPAGRFRHKKWLNLWTDWAVQPKKGDWSLLDQLLLEGLCAGNREAYEYCLNWAAYMVQFPDRPAEVAIVFRGEKGTGKGTWGRALAKLCGRHGMQISNQQHFTGHFNAHMRDCLAGDTLILTREFGSVPIASVAGQEVTLLDGDGNWVKCPIVDHGIQQTIETTFRSGRGKTGVVIRSTLNHGWMANGEKVLTQDMVRGQVIDALAPSKQVHDADAHRLGVLHGLVYGDGSSRGQADLGAFQLDVFSHVESHEPWLEGLHRTKIKYNTGISSGTGWSYRVPRALCGGRDLKALPDPKTESQDYLLGFIRGWFAADGCVARDGCSYLACGGAEVDWLRQWGPVVGWRFLAASRFPNVTNLGRRNKELFALRVEKRCLVEDDMLIAQHRINRAQDAETRRPPAHAGWKVMGIAPGRLERVYCPSVPTTGSFALASGIHSSNCIFLFIDEAIWAGDKKAEGELKRLITEDTLAIEAKGKDVVFVRNMLHNMIASNENYVVPASLGDERRFQVNDVSSRFKDDHKFFEALNKQLDSGGLQALLWDLKTRDIRDFHPRRGIPKTGALAKQKLAGMEHLDAWWYNCLLTRSLGADIHAVEGDWNTGKARFLSFDIQQSVELYLQKAGDRQRMRRSTMTSVGDKFKQNVPKARHIRFMAPKDRLDLGEWVNKDGRTYGYDLPSVDDCRLAFEARIGEALQWDLDAVDAEEFVDASVADVQDDFDPLDVDPLA